MTVEEMGRVVDRCRFPDYLFAVMQDERGAIYLQANYPDRDVKTGKLSKQWTRRWFLSPAMTASEVVQTAFKCVVTSMEHRAREFFTYRERAIFGPHFDVEALWSICTEEALEYRKP